MYRQSYTIMKNQEFYFAIVKTYENITRLQTTGHPYNVYDTLVDHTIYKSYYEARDMIKEIKEKFFKETSQWTDSLQDEFFYTLRNIDDEEIRVTVHTTSIYVNI